MIEIHTLSFKKMPWKLSSGKWLPFCRGRNVLIANDTFRYSNLNWAILRMSQYFASWWRHQMETFSALLAICAGNSPAPGQFPTQRPVTRSFDVFFDQRANIRLSKHWWSWWFETHKFPLWRHRNVMELQVLCGTQFRDFYHPNFLTSAIKMVLFHNSYHLRKRFFSWLDFES